MTEQGTEAAKLQVESWYQKDKVLVVFLPECHESLAGIIAGRLREYYQKPAIVLTRGEEAVKGSGRSIDEYHMFKKLTEVSESAAQIWRASAGSRAFAGREEH